MGLRRREARDAIHWLFDERIEHSRRAKKWQTKMIGPRGHAASDDAVILPRERNCAQAGQFIHDGCGSVRIGRGVPDDQFEWLAKDSAGIVDIVDGQLKARKQMLAGFDPAGPTQRNECADSEGCFVGSTGFRYRL
jgi:hypothetical protein